MSIYAVNDTDAKRGIACGAAVAIIAISFRSGGLWPFFMIGGAFCLAIIFPFVIWPAYMFLKRTGRLTIWWSMSIAVVAVSIPELALTAFSILSDTNITLKHGGIYLIQDRAVTLAGWFYFFMFRPIVYYVPIGVIAGAVGWLVAFGLCREPEIE